MQDDKLELWKKPRQELRKSGLTRRAKPSVRDWTFPGFVDNVICHSLTELPRNSARSETPWPEDRSEVGRRR